MARRNHKSEYFQPLELLTAKKKGLSLLSLAIAQIKLSSISFALRPQSRCESIPTSSSAIGIPHSELVFLPISVSPHLPIFIS
jgi:hypothetical protein